MGPGVGGLARAFSTQSLDQWDPRLFSRRLPGAKICVEEVGGQTLTGRFSCIGKLGGPGQTPALRPDCGSGGKGAGSKNGRCLYGRSLPLGLWSQSVMERLIYRCLCFPVCEITGLARQRSLNP